MNDLFDFPVSRTTDPETSHKAEAEHTSSGKRATRAGQIARLLHACPGQTFGELSLSMYKAYPELGFTVCAQTPSKRIADLEKAGLVARWGTKICRDTGRECTAWFLTEKGRTEYQQNGESISPNTTDRG